MALLKLRGMVMTLALASALLAVPAEGEACGLFDCLFGWCRGPCVPTTTYRPAYVAAYAPACPTPCTSCYAPCVTQTCNYVPQTCYRTVCQRVPVTAYQPVSLCDPCTGCAMTTYRPITTWAVQTQLVPYTTYRLVCSNVCAPAVAAPNCNPCPGVAPAATYAVPAAGAVTSPGSWESAPPAAPALGPMPGPEPTTVAPPYSQTQPPGNGLQAPANGAQAPSGGTPPPTTFDTQRPATEPKKIEPTPDANSDTAPAGPKIVPQGRETSLPISPGAPFRLISQPGLSLPIQTAAAPNGWRAGRD